MKKILKIRLLNFDPLKIIETHNKIIKLKNYLVLVLLLLDTETEGVGDGLGITVDLVFSLEFLSLHCIWLCCFCCCRHFALLFLNHTLNIRNYLYLVAFQNKRITTLQEETCTIVIIILFSSLYTFVFKKLKNML